jgi:hypothetical protein
VLLITGARAVIYAVGNDVTVAHRVLGQAVDIPKVVLQCHPILIRLFPATSEQFAKL